MTRINVVPVQELSRQHLIAEYRELPRIFNLVKAAIERGELPNDRKNPVEYCLGTGHCRFFYDKLGFLYQRQADICREMRRRGYQVSYDHYGLGEDIYTAREWWGDYLPTEAALALNRARIAERNGDTSDSDRSGRTGMDVVQEHRIPTGEQSLRSEDGQA